MGIAKDKKLHEVLLKTDVIDALSKIAAKENRSPKNLMENILIAYANNNKLKQEEDL